MREIWGNSIQRNVGGGQSAVHVDCDGIIDDVLTVFAEVISSQIADGAPPKSKSIDFRQRHP
jgi:hypothetical protein